MKMRSHIRNLPGLCLAIMAAAAILASSSAWAGDDRPEQIRAELRDMEHKIKTLKAEGRHEEAAAVAREAGELREKAMHMQKERGEGAPERPKAEAGERIRHLREAAGHLHAAGLHDLAERLESEAQRGETTWREAPGGERGRPPVEAELEQMRAELQELRQALRKLNARLDEQGRGQP
jgi:chromosome segregation ATPase